MTKLTKLYGYATKAARAKAIRHLHKKYGYNYFVCYDDKKLRFALQAANSKSRWVHKHAKRGITVTGD